MRTALFALIGCCLSFTAMATADGPDHYRVSGVSPGSFLNLRAGPGTGAPIIGRIPAGMTCLRNLGCQGGLSLEEFTMLSNEEKQRRALANPRWCKVDYAGAVGWVSGRFLAEGACSEIAPEQTQLIVEFPEGKDNVSLKGCIQGREFVDYRFRGAAGQSLTVRMTASHSANYFNLLPPDSPDAAMYIGQIGGNRFEGMLPTDGDYTIRVYLMRSAGRRNATSDYDLDIILAGKALVPLPDEEDARIPGTPYHAQAKIACVLPYEPETKYCEASVIRRGFEGTASVEVRSPRLYLRRILFIKGKPVVSDSTHLMTFLRQGDLTEIEFDEAERLEIPDALISGG
jgi:hypothetical protein